ncbi:SusD/RagB family nutrient-binding outer membrane lipoprotein [Pedobacter ginsengisoli]|uniref:SusD/RagB family nutrient-binding outer membrane lipoprotein n=1 Tax=Pedobacter ginsengisoli TaxID=363852 RepID=A0A2D1UBW4_9SPHI|nr:SusD/RagB family nutrient-binding outer membrane lipoprotein [Pedobacter ginsengisoli]ATP59051.1 SusD/RagB family nutrient-binding outer membrane lipoprotein [Pedobacter ginsengisoli]
MKRIIKYMLILPLLAMLTNGCKKFEDINTNPNETTQVNSAMLATGMILNITRGDISSTKGFMQPFLLGKYLTWGEGQEGFQYNRLGRTDFDRITLLRNIPSMENYATSDALKKSYQGLGHFIRAWQFFMATMQVGDIPYAEAVKGETNVLQPKYDTQKAVFMGILNELDQANQLFATGANFEGDPIYAGNVDKWRRLTNSFELHVLINLYKKTADADLKVIDRFKDIVANRPLMRDYRDNFALVYNNTAGQNYPWSDVPAGSGNSFVKSNYTMLTNTLLAPLKATDDRRLFYYAKPSPVKITAGVSQSDYNAYPGVEPSDAFSALQTRRVGKDYADLNNRYVQLVNAEPVSVFSCWDMQFALAEAAVRGWITGTAAQVYYADGITNSMNAVAINTPDLADYHHNMKMDAAYILAFPAKPGVALAGSTEEQIKQIITQKYLANFLQGGKYQSWFENRRTGYPVFTLNSTTNLNTPSTNFPLRWLYPSNELSYNSDNLDAAVQSQYGGNDNTNQQMWLLK